MEKENINAPLLSALEEIKSYFAQQITYNKLLLSKRMYEMSAGIFLFVILSGIGALALLSLSLAFVYWYAFYFGRNTYEGFLILAAFYAVTGTLVIIFRQQWIYNPLRKMMGDILFSEEESDDAKGIKPDIFRSKEDLHAAIEKAHDDLKQQENDLKVVFDQLSKQYTLKNITQYLAKSAYSSFVSTANIAKASFFLISMLKGKKKKHKKLRK